MPRALPSSARLAVDVHAGAGLLGHLPDELHAARQLGLTRRREDVRGGGGPGATRRCRRDRPQVQSVRLLLPVRSRDEVR